MWPSPAEPAWSATRTPISPAPSMPHTASQATPEFAARALRSRPPNKKDQGDLRPWTPQLSFSRHSKESGWPFSQWMNRPNAERHWSGPQLGPQTTLRLRIPRLLCVPFRTHAKRPNCCRVSSMPTNIRRRPVCVSFARIGGNEANRVFLPLSRQDRAIHGQEINRPAISAPLGPDPQRFGRPTGRVASLSPAPDPENGSLQ